MSFSLSLGKLGLKLVLDDSEWKTGMAATLGGIGKLGAGIGAMGGLAVGGIGLAIREFARLQTAVYDAAAVSKEGAANIGAFYEAAILAGSNSRFSAIEAAEGLKYLSMAGLSATEAMAALPQVLQMATASGVSLAETADIATNIMSGMGLTVAELPRVMDVLTATFTTSNTDLKGLAESMKYVGPVASSMGQSLEDSAAILGKLASNGIQASQAGTAVRMSLARLAKLNEKPTGRAAEALKSLGTSLYDAQGGYRSLIDVIGDLEGAQARLKATAFNDALVQVFGVEALPAINALLKEGSEKLREYSGELENAEGRTKSIAELMDSTAAAQFEILKGQVSTLSAMFGQLFIPALSIVTRELGKMVNALISSDETFNDVKGAVVEGLRAFGQFVEGAKPVVGFFGSLIGMGSEVVNVFQIIANEIEGIAYMAGTLGAAIASPIHFAKNFGAIQEQLDKEMAAISARSTSLMTKMGDGYDKWTSRADKLAEAMGGLVGLTNEAADATDKLTKKQVVAAGIKQLTTQPKKPGAGAGDTAYKEAAAEKARLKELADSFLAEQMAEIERSKSMQRDIAMHNKIATERRKEAARIEVAEAKARQKFEEQVASEMERARQAMQATRQSSMIDATTGTLSTLFSHLGEIGALADKMVGAIQAIAQTGDPMVGAVMMGQAWAETMITFVAQNEGVQEKLGVLSSALDGLSPGALLTSFTDVYKGAIGAFLGIVEAIKPIGELLGMGGLKDQLGRSLFNGTKAILDGGFVIAEAFVWVGSKISWIASKMVDGITATIAKVNGWLSKVGVDVDLGGVMAFRDKLRDVAGKWSEAGDIINDAQAKLGDMTYDSAVAIYEETAARKDATAATKEFTDAMRNAPAGFKIAQERWRAQNAQGTADRASDMGTSLEFAMLEDKRYQESGGYYAMAQLTSVTTMSRVRV